MAPHRKIKLAVEGDDGLLHANYIEGGDRTLRQLLSLFPNAKITTIDAPLDAAVLDRTLRHLTLDIADAAQWPPGTRHYPLPDDCRSQTEQPAADAIAGLPEAPTRPPGPLPAAARVDGATLSEGEAVAIAYGEQATKLAGFLLARLSVRVTGEKQIASHLCARILALTLIPHPDGRSPDIRPEPIYLDMPSNQPPDALAEAGGGRLGELRKLISELKPTQILVIRHLDLMGGGDRTPGREARELTELIYSALDRIVLAFADPSLNIPEVITARFAVRADVQGLPRSVPDGNGGRRPIEDALLTARETSHFKDLASADVYKHIAGLNPARLRQAMAYAVQMAGDEGYGPGHPAPLDALRHSLRMFKAQTAELFTVPDVRFEDIGGYDDVKAVLRQAIRILSGAGRLPDEALRNELVPRGFLFHGPPGTGKTLFAKAIANSLNATIRVVSGPEVTDMYVGESERKVRVIFAEARRNAPSVIVFDEFDSIAASRTGRDDGGSRAGNALVAQILTEMDGFRPEVPILVVGTTNRLGLIDKALLRPSRFQPVAIGLPDLAARRRIALIHARHFRIDANEELLDLIAEATEGLNGDEVRSVFRDAAVGFYCDELPADAARLGYLVGRLRTRIDAETIHEPEAVRHDPAQGRRRPRAGLVPLVPNAEFVLIQQTAVDDGRAAQASTSPSPEDKIVST